MIEFPVLAQQGFSKTNKVSRILIKDDQGRGIYYIKAVYEEIEEYLKLELEDRILLSDTINTMTKQGLRTMVLAYKELSADDLNEFELQLDSAKSFPVNIEARISKLYPIIEFDLEVLGITGIEEIVSKETENCIQVMKEAGLKIWVLSGDSEANTISTVQKAGIFTSDTNIFRINLIKSELQCIKMLKKAISHLIFHEEGDSISHMIKYLTRKSTVLRKDESFHDYKNTSNNDSFSHITDNALVTSPAFAKLSNHDEEIYSLLSRKFVPENLNYSLSIDKVSLRTALEYPDSRKLLVCLLICADSVAFHSLLPHDKASVARLLKENVSFSPLTLAIGDGDADIPMMQAADVAVLIRKPETQVISYCEVSINKFSQLKKLLLEYGHWNLYRMANTILLFLYKNFLITATIFVYFCIGGYSDHSIYADS